MMALTKPKNMLFSDILQGKKYESETVLVAVSMLK